MVSGWLHSELACDSFPIEILNPSGSVTARMVPHSMAVGGMASDSSGTLDPCGDRVDILDGGAVEPKADALGAIPSPSRSRPV